MWLLWGGVAFAAARLCFMLLYLSREYASRLRPHAELLKKQLAYALPYQAYVLAESMQSNLHHYVVSHSFNAATFAIYSVGCLQIPLVEFVASPVCDVMMVSMSEAMRDGQKGRVLELWHNTTRKLAMLFFPLFGILLLSGHDLIVFLFTGAYAASVPVFMFSEAGLLYTLLYAFLLFRFGPLSDKERQRIIQWLRRPVAESLLGEAERFQT